MYIQAAMSEALQTNKGIYRRNDRWPKGLWVLPTNTSLNLVLVTPEGKCGCNWAPRIDDLLADDWVVL